MKLSTETFTPLIKKLQDFNQEIRLRHSSTHSFTEQEMKSLVQSCKETEKMVNDLESLSSIVSLHLKLLEIELTEQLQKATSKD